MSPLLVNGARGAPLSLSLASDEFGDGFAAVELRGFDSEALARLLGTEWESDLAVFVAIAAPGGRAPAPVLAEYRLLADGVSLTPVYPWVRGLSYRARADLRHLLPGETTPPSDLVFSFPKESNGLRGEVEHVHPTGGLLPENLLRFYLHFSTPMQRGKAYDQITLNDGDDRPVADALYRPPVELWDPPMRRLTVLLDPGRLKRHVGPNAQLGAPMQEAGLYTLQVGAGLLDATGIALGKPAAKTFRVGPPVRNRIIPTQWRTSEPRSGTNDPLKIDFPVPLDAALGPDAILVVDEWRDLIAGRHVLDLDEMRCIFTPAAPWVGGCVHLLVDPGLEDVCGNNLHSPFDAPSGLGVQCESPGPAVSLRVPLSPDLLQRSLKAQLIARLAPPPL